MNPSNYTKEQQTDIEDRVKKGIAALKELNLQPSSAVQAVNTGNDVFATKIISYLQDTKYTSPIKKSDL